ncbi:TRAP transporter small permease [Ruegeria pomeroyi]|uniref:TRAP transporter small permease protein n=2 Tax=Ruegeria TaxID=97050 RepID=A0A9Q3WLW0_9RHOB|nr:MULTISPECIES: TRAP transporter small permease [Ruegeria]MCE8508728.1 TRAP transporter small permease [Ruegeria pomeroyi]MCE8512250.1 TRAP transporter small permease [Ruegeria pomeroyi]MCE8515275.1 TRAP transporter small permease [Ruegeria pomeroyi]MCE8520819.1 TRAP transporter small permease [Ruegeria pomeroyi]MCE8524628.1 TRAP transporter small permease [Ruegeria pomeroyi]
MALLRGLRSGLDLLYLIAGVLAAMCLVGILGLIVVQMLARWTGEVFPGAPDYAGYAMAAASFLAFANALNRGSHIRVSILLNAVPDGLRRWIEVWCFGIGTAVMWYFVWYAYRFVYWSWKFNDISQGQDRTPLWIPQSAMLLGAVILAIALTDHLIHVIFKGDHRITRDLADQSHGE